MADVIEDFIRRNPGSRTEAEAFDSFLAQDKIRAWVGADGTRRERLRREFASTWSRVHDAGAQVTVRVTPAPAPASASNAARRLQVLCPSCRRTEVWSEAGRLSCRSCGRVFDDMLHLVPVKPVGPFAFLFGEGARGWLTAGGIALALLALYGALRWS